MRWLGAARRALDHAMDHVNAREAFGQRLGELGMVQERVAESIIEIDACRAMIWRCAWILDDGQHGRHESSVTKAFVGEAVNRIVDRSMQISGALGVSSDGPVSTLFKEIRPFRIYDGPTEVHHWTIARRALRQRAAEAGA
jgi:acyl-CoA dehydrogenase